MPILEWPIMNPCPSASTLYEILRRKNEYIVLIVGDVSVGELERLQQQLGIRDINIRIYHVCEDTKQFTGSRRYAERVSQYLFITRGAFYAYGGQYWHTAKQPQ